MIVRRASGVALVALAVALLAMLAPASSARGASRPESASGSRLQWANPAQIPFDSDVAPSCVSRNFCIAITSDGAVYRYNGARWTGDSRIDAWQTTGLSCVSKSFCMATDIEGRAVRFDGNRWRTPVAVADGQSWLSCSPDETCVLAALDGAAFQYRNGAWAPIARILEPQQAQSPREVRNVSCVSADYCIALTSPDDTTGVGSYRFDGDQWHPIAGPAVDSTAAQFTELSCTSTSFCAATDATLTVATIFDGTSWATPHAIEEARFSKASGSSPVFEEWHDFRMGISCWADGECAAVSPSGAFARYDGTGWHTTYTAYTASTSRAVSCSGADFCVMGGQYNVRTWNGADISDPQYIAPAVLGTQLSCVRVGFCMVMGPIRGGAAVYDGTRLMPSTAVFPDVLTKHMTSWPMPSLDCTSQTFCLAVDAHEAAVWNGKRWSVPIVVDSVPLTSVSCASTALCIAFDAHDRAVMFRNRHWSVPRHLGFSAAVSVSCAAGPICAAVDYTGTERTYRNGKWSARQSLGTAHGAPFTVSCGSTTLCLIANNKGTMYRYRGRSFGHREAVFGLHGGGLFALSCVGDTFCAAADVNSFGNKVQSAAWTASRSWGPKRTIPTKVDPLSDPEDPLSESAEGMSCPTPRQCYASYDNYVDIGTVKV
jgi:hypothetical protein